MVLLFQWGGVPLTVICDNAKEMVLGKFNRKLKEASYDLKQMEPLTPWSNEAEKEIKELKKGSGKKPKIGMLFHLVKCSRPGIASTSREISKVMNGTNQATFLEMHCVFKYVLDTWILGLKIESNRNNEEPWNIVHFGHSKYSGDLICY